MVKAQLVDWMFVFGLALFGAGAAYSQQIYPGRPIRIIASEAGGGTDFVARQIALGISVPLGQSVIVDNRPSNIDGEIAAKSLPDGYSLLVEGVSFWVAPLLQKMPYDVIRDFLPITQTSTAPYLVVVHPSVVANTVKDLIEMAKAKPGTLNYASAGIGGGAHLAMELFKSMTGVNIVHVPYKGTGPATIGLIGGQVQVMVANPAGATPHVKSGKLRALAVTSAQPSALAPGLPTVAASGLPGYEYGTLTSLFAPARTPAAIINRLNQESVRFLRTPDAKEKFLSAGLETVGTTPAVVAAAIKADIAKWGKVISSAGIKLE